MNAERRAEAVQILVRELVSSEDRVSAYVKIGYLVDETLAALEGERAGGPVAEKLSTVKIMAAEYSGLSDGGRPDSQLVDLLRTDASLAVWMARKLDEGWPENPPQVR